jgi:hypothetical protein
MENWIKGYDKLSFEEWKKISNEINHKKEQIQITKEAVQRMDILDKKRLKCLMDNGLY